MTGSSPSISVVVPTLNRRELVRRAVESVLEQTFRDFELIVVDDASTDGTAEALAPFHDRLVYVAREKANGVSSARNAALRIAKGNIVAFLDSDNRWLPDHLAIVHETLALHPEAVLVCTSPQFLLAGRRRPEQARVIDPLPRLLVNNFVGYVSCVAVRRSALDAVGGFDERMLVAEDSDLWLRLAFQGPFAMLQRRTALIQVTSGSLSERGRRSGAYLDAIEHSYERLDKALAELSEDPRGLRPRVRGARRLVAALRALDTGDLEKAREALREACALFPELSEEPSLVAGRLEFNLPTADDPRERLRLFSTAAAFWPDQRSDTALALRAAATVAALRVARPLTAARLAAGFPLGPTASFAVGRAPGSVLLFIRRRLGPLVRRGRETANLDAGSDVSQHDGGGGHQGPLADGHMVADGSGHPEEDVVLDSNVAGDVHARVERDEGADPRVVSDENASRDDAALADLRERADDGARPDDGSFADDAAR